MTKHSVTGSNGNLSDRRGCCGCWRAVSTSRGGTMSAVPGNQTRTDILDRVLSDLDGRGPQKSWGEVHQVTFDHPLTRLSFVRKLAADSWSRGPFAVGGGNATINGNYWSERHPFAVTAIPAMRFVADVGNWDDTVLVLPVGQSGRPWSRHYSNQISSWLNVEAVRFPFSREAVDAAATVRIELSACSGKGVESDS